ncbi:hypothetical protein RJ45_04710 [Photobacterium gaetbulicola]|uniref:DUF72 domain-containing protein n=1 Tax=Photobacterium gaetbulicola TaxID=1295392 RepID=A0A0B9H795_9GAMM|nr:DUF72 domain-containing protein [Photobacterium gaetbulicola]KHT64767.1 hypothetical protein RJ45_04710 [Photobacterium gaetbulicola]
MPSTQANLPVRLGLAMWSHNHWQQSLYGSGCKAGDRLARYAEVFHTVEGNTTFYATPGIPTVKKWHEATGNHFRFTFKLPQAITHQNQLVHCDQLLADFFTTMAPLEGKIGLWKVQLPAQFGPAALPALEKFLQRLPASYPIGVEVRHPAFFAKGEEEKQLNRLLIEHGANRIIMDSRPVFAAPPTTEAVIDAHQKKPKVPVHAIATATSPMIRFIGHPIDASNDAFFANWLVRLPQWLRDGKEPFLFIHTPDNNHAPELATRLYRLLQQKATDAKLPDVELPKAEPDPQIALL